VIFFLNLISLDSAENKDIFGKQKPKETIQISEDIEVNEITPQDFSKYKKLVKEFCFKVRCAWS
jgi:hypothetical protein